MSCKTGRFLGAVAALVLMAGGTAEAGELKSLGRPPTPAEIAAWDIDVRPDGEGLPVGRGSASQGGALFAERCEGCHPDGGTKALAPSLDVLVGGVDALHAKPPVRTIGNYWPEAATLFDYIRRAMPFDRPQSLTGDEVYALTAFLLARNGIIPADAVLDQISLPRVAMPNRNGFIERDDWRAPKAPTP